MITISNKVLPGILLALFVVSNDNCFAQEVTVSFESQSISTKRDPKRATILPIVVKSEGTKDPKWEGYSLSIEVAIAESSLPVTAYELNFNEIELSKMKASEKAFLTLKMDTLPDRERSLILNLKIKKPNGHEEYTDFKSSARTLVINVGENAKKEALAMDTAMNYRLLIGSNFDFIDGTQLKNLYYHMQVFQPTAFSDNIGFIGGIQQSRLISQRNFKYPESLEEERKLLKNFVRLNDFTSLTGDSVAITRLLPDSITFDENKSSTVFQMYLEPTYNIFPMAQSEKQHTDLLIFFHGDVQYIKTNIETGVISSSLAVRDTIHGPRLNLSKYKPVDEARKVDQIDEYRYHFGPGILLRHQHQNIVDLYAKFMTGRAKSTVDNWDWFYGCEVGIRIPSINVMLGAEFRGLYSEQTPRNFNVYLSKVFSFSGLKNFILQ